MAVELALPVANWQNKTSGERSQDIASVALEWQGKTNIYWTTPGQIVRLTDTNRTDTDTYDSENTATFEIVQWFFSDAECLGWLSALKDGVYTTTRFGLKKKYTDGGREIRVLNVDIYLKIPVKECVSLYAKFVEADVEDITPEDFRDRPIEFNLPEGKTFNDLIHQFTGKDLLELMTEKQAVTRDAVEIEQKNVENIRSARTEYQQIFIGARIEDELIKRGHAIRESTGCPGVSNREALRELIQPQTVGFVLVGYDTAPRNYKFDHEGVCGVCGLHKRDLGPCGICEHCDRSGAYKNKLAAQA